MRLHWFLPLKRGKDDKTPIRRLLRWLGPTWLASPWRRLTQAIALCLFLWLFLYVTWPYTIRPPGETADGWPSHYADHLAAKEWLPAELFLMLDPLGSLTAAVAARAWIPALSFAGLLLILSLFIPRGFCGYICPLGTCIDLFDGAIGKRFRSPRLQPRGWWRFPKYLLLGVAWGAAVFGVTLAGYLAAIPLFTRGWAFVVSPLQLGLSRSFQQIPPFGAGQWLSIALFASVFALGLFGQRFWCRYVCPTGALFSITNTLRLTERVVRTGCVACSRCQKICPFDAIDHDYTTRVLDCTFCQTCGGSCPVQVIEFRERPMGRSEPKQNPHAVGISPRNKPRPTAVGRSVELEDMSVSRRNLLKTGASFAIGGAAGAGLAGILRATPVTTENVTPVRAPGSVPESDFLRMCVRCGNCLQACPNSVLQPLGLSSGVLGLWTPAATLDWSGCEPSCNNCGQVCPTGAIRAIALEEKRAARMGLAVVDTATCLPYAGRGDCRLCVDECDAAGYRAIELRPVGEREMVLDEFGELGEDTRPLGPFVLAEKCVGCGLCQSRCRRVLVEGRNLLGGAAIVVHAGQGFEDRMANGSYVELRRLEEEERRRERAQSLQIVPDTDAYLPDFL